MKIIPEIIVQDPSNISMAVHEMVDEIIDLINKRVTDNSKIFKKIDANLYVYIGVDVNVNENLFKPLKNNLLFGADNSTKVIPETTDICAVIKNAINSRISLPEVVKKCFVYLSFSAIDKNVLTKTDNKDEVASSSYIAVDPIFSLDEVVMNKDERDAIMRAITLVKEKDLVYKKWGFSKVDKHTKSVLCFHGVPGTGKTMAAHGVASYLGKKILIGSYAQIESEFVGVGAKNLKNFFQCAKEQDCVLFIDEADTFLSKRLPSSNDSAKHYNSMSNELYQLVEDFDGCIIFASNHIKDFDPAIISRIIEPIEFKLPDVEGRKQIIDKLLQDEFPIEGGKTDDIITELAELTDGFSGRDIRKALLICNADAAYKLKVESAISDDDIVVPVEMIFDCFNSVKKAKDKLDAALGKKITGNLLNEFTEDNLKKTRYMQMAAHTLLVDGIIEPREVALYESLSKSMGVKVPLDKDALPSVEEICSKVKSAEEKMQFIDVVTRMAAIDDSIPDIEMDFVVKVLNLLGIGDDYKEEIIAYTRALSDSYKQLNIFKEQLGKSDTDILTELKKEYSEAAAYHHLAQMYRDGSQFMGGIKENAAKAEYYFNKAKDAGYESIANL